MIAVEGLSVRQAAFALDGVTFAVPSGAYAVMMGRTGIGKTTVLEDLTTALENGTIGGAGLDVYEIEPLPADHRLWTLPNVLLTPHIAVHDAENIPERRYQILLDNARRFAAGEPLKNVVDKTAWY